MKLSLSIQKREKNVSVIQYVTTYDAFEPTLSEKYTILFDSKVICQHSTYLYRFFVHTLYRFYTLHNIVLLALIHFFVFGEDLLCFINELIFVFKTNGLLIIPKAYRRSINLKFTVNVHFMKKKIFGLEQKTVLLHCIHILFSSQGQDFIKLSN